MKLETINEIIVIIGLPAVLVTLIGASIYIGRKLQILDDLVIVVEKMKNNIKVLADAITVSKSVPMDTGRLQSYSPIRLTEKGNEFLKETGFIKVFNENKDKFFSAIDDENPNTKYDVEKVGTRIVLFLSNEQWFSPVKEYLYNHPDIWDMGSFASTAGVYVRDKYLEEHTEIDV